MSNKVFIAIMTVILVGVVFVANRSSSDDGDSGTQTDTLAIQENDRFLAKPENSKATFIEYSDFECPACATYYPLISQAKDEYGDRVTFVFRHFPLTNIHPSAMAAHRIAEASNNQGKFIEIHDLLFEQNRTWTVSSNTSETIYSLIQRSGLDIDIERLKSDMASGDTSKVIGDHQKGGRSLGVTGTPTFYLDGGEIDFTSYEELQQLLEFAINKDSSDTTDTAN